MTTPSTSPSAGLQGAERALTERALNRALLARQSLLERWKRPIPRAIERMGGVQSQYAPSAYVGLWSRLDGLERTDLTGALERRTARYLCQRWPPSPWGMTRASIRSRGRGRIGRHGREVEARSPLR